MTDHTVLLDPQMEQDFKEYFAATTSTDLPQSIERLSLSTLRHRRSWIAWITGAGTMLLAAAAAVALLLTSRGPSSLLAPGGSPPPTAHQISFLYAQQWQNFHGGKSTTTSTVHRVTVSDGKVIANATLVDYTSPEGTYATVWPLAVGRDFALISDAKGKVATLDLHSGKSQELDIDARLAVGAAVGPDGNQVAMATGDAHGAITIIDLRSRSKRMISTSGSAHVLRPVLWTASGITAQEMEVERGTFGLVLVDPSSGRLTHLKKMAIDVISDNGLYTASTQHVALGDATYNNGLGEWNNDLLVTGADGTTRELARAKNHNYHALALSDNGSAIYGSSTDFSQTATLAPDLGLYYAPAGGKSQQLTTLTDPQDAWSAARFVDDHTVVVARSTSNLSDSNGGSAEIDVIWLCQLNQPTCKPEITKVDSFAHNTAGFIAPIPNQEANNR